MTERRWLLVASDGRHVTLGRATDPSPDEIYRAAETLKAQGLGGWLAVSEGNYYGTGPYKLMLVRPVAESSGATWEQALAAFLNIRAGFSRPPIV